MHIYIFNDSRLENLEVDVLAAELASVEPVVVGFAARVGLDEFLGLLADSLRRKTIH